jgi:hypothetical protein
MEDVLDLYAQPYAAEQPVVCFDEKFVLLHADAHPTQPVAPGVPERVDYEYVRAGSANLFFFVEPLSGWRHVSIRARRTRQDYAECLRYLADERYPAAQKIRLVQDNLNTHLTAALYETFVPSEARRIARRFEFHYTPKHASWLNMAEIEIGIFERGCLRQRCPDVATLEQRIGALEAERNAAACTIHWRFTTCKARQKLAHLYPIEQS